eukprot:gene7986-8808_t
MSSFTSSSVGSVKWVSCNEQGSLQVAKVDSVLKPVWNQTTNLISIFGRPRQGKSFLMNCLAGETDIFRISNEKESCTQGIDLSRKFMKLEEFSRVDQGYGLPNKNHHSSNSFVGFVDAEGQGDKDVSYDANLICPILLTSKCVIFNWKGDLQKNYILSTLGIMTRAAQNVAQEGSTGRHKFGHLHIVFRDWQAVESDANSTYAALFNTESSHEASTRNQIRHDVLEAFQSVQVWLFEAPTERVADLRKNLTIDLTSTSFREHIRSLRRVLAAQLSEPTVLAGQVVTGRLLTGLVSNLQDTLNRGEAVLPSSAYLAMLRQEVVGLKDAYDKEARKMLADLPVEALGDFPPTMNEITASVQEQFHELDLVYEVKLVEIIGSHPSPDSQGLVRDFHASVKTLQENLISAFLSAQRNRFGAWLLEKKQLAQKIFEEELKKMIETDKDLLSDEDLRARLDEIWQSTVLTPLGGVDRYDDYPEHIDAIKTLEWIFKNLSEQVRKANQKRVEENQALADRLTNEAIKPIDVAVEKVLDRIRSASVPGLHQRDISGSLNQLHAEKQNDLQQRLRKSPFLGVALAQFNQHCSTRLEDIQALYHDKANAAYGDAIDRAEHLLQDRFQTLAQQWDDLEDGVQIDSAIQDIDQSIHNIWKEVVTSVHGWMDVDCQEEAMAEHPFGRELKGLLNRQREPFVYALQELLAQQEEDAAAMDIESKDVIAPVPSAGGAATSGGGKVSVAEQRRRAREWAMKSFGPPKTQPRKKTAEKPSISTMAATLRKNPQQQRAAALAYAREHFQSLKIQSPSKSATAENSSSPLRSAQEMKQEQEGLRNIRDAARKALEERAQAQIAQLKGPSKRSKK